MREIKFRVYNTRVKRWMSFSLNRLIVGKADKFSLDLVHWSEFTGLKDKNGKEIYSGDYVVMETWNGGDGVEEPSERDEFEGAVIWGKDSAGYGLKTEGCKEDEVEVDLVSNEPFVTLEIIGNIYSNPELLKEE